MLSIFTDHHAVLQWRRHHHLPLTVNPRALPIFPIVVVHSILCQCLLTPHGGAKVCNTVLGFLPGLCITHWPATVQHSSDQACIYGHDIHGLAVRLQLQAAKLGSHKVWHADLG